jgi:hypothetical protein
MKRLIFGMLALVLAGGSRVYAAERPRPPAHAATPPNCYQRYPDPACFTPNNGGGDGGRRGLLDDLVKNKAQVIADLRATDKMVSAIVPGSSPPRMWDSTIHQCLVGIGKAGEPDHVQGLIAFIEGLSAPPEPPAPSADDPNNPMVFSKLVEGLLTVESAETNIGTIVSNGFPDSLNQSCGAMITKFAALQGKAVAQAVSVAALIGLIVPK